jgi:hypothetical protein
MNRGGMLGSNDTTVDIPMRLSYRRFAFFLLFLATMVLAAAWLGSLRTWRECTVIMQPCTFHFSLRSGTAVAFAATHGASGYGIQPSSYAVHSGDGHPEQYRPMGTFLLTTISLPIPGSAGHHGYTIGVPVWLPYLLFIASVLGWLKVRSLQTDATTEKALATRHAEEKEAESPTK